MSSTRPSSARGARARSSGALLVLAAVACDTNSPPALDPAVPASSLIGVGMILDVPTVALAVGAAGTTLHAMRPDADRIDTVAAAWHSSDEQVVSVGADGRLTPRRAGQATVWARVGRDSVPASVTVTERGPSASVNAATVAVRPAVAMLAVGAPQQFTATVQAAATGLLTVAGVAAAAPNAPAVTWSSSAPTVAAVSSNGTVVPIAPGIAVITATALGVRATSTVLVAAPRASAAARIDVAVMRFDGGSGQVMVSNGIPFPRGAVTENSLGQVHVFVNGTERPIRTRALSGRWPDGSLRAALVQFDYVIPDAQPIPGYVTVGGTRTLTPPAERAAVPTPVAAVLPTSSAYLMSTGLGGPLYDPATTKAPTSLIAQYESDYVRLAAGDWSQCGSNWSCGRTAGYDRAFILYQEWLRTANPTYWQHASAIVANYIDQYLAPANGGPAPWWSNSESMALHYFSTGDERTRGYLYSMATSLMCQDRPIAMWRLGGDPSTQLGDDRARAKVIAALMDVQMTNAVPTATSPDMTGGDAMFCRQYMTNTVLTTAINDILGTQHTSGAFGGTQYNGGQKNFMVGMLLTQLIRYYDQFTPDARIPTAVQRAVDYMTANEWIASAQGFKYVTTNVDADDGDWPEPTLNNLVAPAYAWLYNRTGNAQYATMVDRMLLANTNNGERSWWAASGKAFDQGFTHTFNTMQWRNR